MTFLLFLVTVLAAHRIVYFLQSDTLTDPIRTRLESRWADTIWLQGFRCPWCLGLYISAALVAGLAQVISIRLPGLVALAVSSGVGIVAAAVEKLER